MISGCTVLRHIHGQRAYLSLVISLLGGEYGLNDIWLYSFETHTYRSYLSVVISLLGGEYGLLSDIWLYSFETHTWTENVAITSDRPAGR